MDTEQSTADPVYYYRRAAEERHRASLCKDSRIALIHQQMADEYVKRAKECAGKASPIPIQGEG